MTSSDEEEDEGIVQANWLRPYLERWRKEKKHQEKKSKRDEAREKGDAAGFSEVISPALNVLKHPDLPFVVAEYLDPRSRIKARTALQDKKGWIPKQVLEYVEKNGKLSRSIESKVDNKGS